jgi:anti-sigma factor RsiW
MGSTADNETGRPSMGRRELAELSALADGTLPAARRPEVEARIAASGELQALYENERRITELLRAGRAVRAPASLRSRIEADRARLAKPRRRLVYGGGLAGALAAVVLAVVLVSPAGTPGAPSVSQAAALASRGASAPAPKPDPRTPGKLERNVEEIYFPDWASSFHWRAVGQRVDHIEGRLARTVYYDWKGKRIAYTIVAAPPLRQPSGQVRQLNGTELRTLTVEGRLVVTWRRAGHSCVLSGAGVPAESLQRLAAWTAPGLEKS